MIEYHVHITSTDQFKQVGVPEKNDRNEINSGGSPHLTMHLCNHLLITSGYLFVIAAVGPGLIFRDDHTSLHNHEYYHERNDDETHMECLAYISIT